MEQSINMYIKEIFITFCPGYVSHILYNDKTFISCKEGKHNVSFVDAIRPPVTKTRNSRGKKEKKILRSLVFFAADTWAVTQ